MYMLHSFCLAEMCSIAAPPPCQIECMALGMASVSGKVHVGRDDMKETEQQMTQASMCSFRMWQSG